MKVKDARHLVRAKTLEEMEIDFGALIVSEEFSRKTLAFEKGTDYRTRAVERLVRTKEEFHTDWNIGRTFREKYVRVMCPYCDTAMKCRGGGGNSCAETDDYTCPSCKAKMHINYPSYHAVSVVPPPVQEEREQKCQK